MSEETETADRGATTELPGVVAALGELKPGTIITEDGVAHLFKRCVTSVKRAVERGELPPPCKLFASNSWTVGALLAHIEKRLQQAAQEQEKEQTKIRRLRP